MVNISMFLIAIGGNAISNDRRDFESQYKVIYNTTYKIANIIKEGNTIVITHGNGPQVGDSLLRHEYAYKLVPPLPLFACVAETQGLLGSMISAALEGHLKALGIEPKVISILARVRVNKDDPAFDNPTKPIGKLYNDDEILEMLKINPSIKFIKMDNKYRRVVPSPDPIEILEEEGIKVLANDGFNVITAGGGGIPIIDNEFIDAVIDKDLTSERLASAIGASKLIFLTNVEGLYINYKGKGERLLRDISIDELDKYLINNEFGKGSMEPKVIASIRFVKNTGREAIIASLGSIKEAINGERGTIIHK